MPTHARTDIREAVANALTGVTAVTQIYEMRSAPYDTLPAINVLTLDEEVVWDETPMNSTVQVRDLRLSIEIISQTLDDEDDDLDEITEDVETVIDNSTQLDTLAWDLNLLNVSFEYDRSSGYPYGMCQMTYSFKYRTDGADPQTVL